ncbi:hypothetical protein LENED_008461 [Lentinula edodes]|uniref:Uncharacterized protein n=1 Tax=Lentinula edodes TaxID=5353 RepID=A0A1Q3EH97_LENED|nr:hypothetical protein LENED_008461 [Lentinula edodes]
MKKDVDKPPKYLYDGRHNPESELKGPPKHIPLTLPPLHQQRLRIDITTTRIISLLHSLYNHWVRVVEVKTPLVIL